MSAGIQRKRVRAHQAVTDKVKGLVILPVENAQEVSARLEKWNQKMSYIKKSQTKFVAAVVGMFVMAIIASRQLYLFGVFRNQQGLLDPQGGRYHLWLAAGAILLASIAACIMFLFFMGRKGSEGSEAAVSPLEPRPTLINVKLNANSLTGDSFNARRWAQLNEWCVEGRADDRRSMNGSVEAGTGSASAQRADARLAHQVMYKEWAGERHD
jgi:hypothetical protein